MTCTRSQEFLAKKQVSAKEVVDARKVSMGRKEALALLGKASELYAAKGKKVVYYNLPKDKPLEADLLACLLGPTGNLRAPALLVGKTLMIGFDEATYKKLFG